MPPQLFLVLFCLFAPLQGVPKPEISKLGSSKVAKRQLDTYGSPAADPQVDTYGAPQTEPCELQGPLSEPLAGASCRPGDQQCQDKCTTVQEEKCSTSYEQQCETVTDQKCETVYENKCETKYDNQCRNEYDDKC